MRHVTTKQDPTEHFAAPNLLRTPSEDIADSNQLDLEQPVWQILYCDSLLSIRRDEAVVIGGLTKRETGKEAREILVVFESLR